MKVIWHALLALFYVAQITAIVLFMEIELVRPIDVTFLSSNVLTGELQTTTKAIYDLRLGHALIALLGLTAAWHLRFALGTRLQRHILEQKINVWRWLIGGLLLGLVAALTALVFGSNDLAYLLLLVALGMACGWLGLLREYLTAQAAHRAAGARATAKLFWQITNKLVFSLQRVIVLLPWLLIAVSLIAAHFWAQAGITREYYLVFAMGMGLAVAWLLNMVFSGRQFAHWRNYAFADTAHFVAHAILFSGWVWLLAMLGA